MATRGVQLGALWRNVEVEGLYGKGCNNDETEREATFERDKPGSLEENQSVMHDDVFSIQEIDQAALGRGSVH